MPVVVLLLAKAAQVRAGSLYGVTKSNNPAAGTGLTVSVSGADFGTTTASFMVCVRVCACPHAACAVGCVKISCPFPD